MAAAQAERETALRQAEEAQRKRATMARIRNIALVAVSMLAAIAVWLGWRAEQQRKVAEEQREQVDQILARAQNIVFQRLDHMDIATLKEVFAVYQMGADRGDANSMENLGMLYANGYGVAQDYAKAHEWFQKAADKGNARATFYLRLLYDNGFGVAQDYAKARVV